MSIRASGRSALIIAAGLWLGLAGPMRATDGAAEPAAPAAAPTESAGAPVKLGKFTKHRSHERHARTKKSAKPETKTVAKVDETTASAAQDSDKHIPLPPTVADANAKVEMPDTAEDLPKTEASALASSAGQMLSGNQGDPAPQADSAPAAAADIVYPDELNEIDRALADDKTAAAPHLALASIDIAPSTSSADTTTQVTASDGSAWNHTSLIGKIFIAFGGLLTLGSAARMFMA
jgi:hypothetical protein